MVFLKRRNLYRLGIILILVLLLPIGLSLASHLLEQNRAMHWWEARNDSTGLAPTPSTTPQAVLQIYTARAFSWRGVFGVHSWIAVKPSNAQRYIRYEVLGWAVRRGNKAVRVSAAVPDGYWFGSYPELLVDLRGAGVDALIEKIHRAAIRYPHMNEYRLWPGPNSNTFIAYIGRSVPELNLDLPPTAIGKDYIAGGGFAALTPSGSGYQLSLYGALGLLVGFEEGLEINLLGLSFGIDPLGPALKLPGLGRIGWGK